MEIQQREIHEQNQRGLGITRDILKKAQGSNKSEKVLRSVKELRNIYNQGYWMNLKQILSSPQI